MIVLALVGLASLFCVGYHLCSTKFPKVGNKIDSFVSNIGETFNKRKNKETISELNSLDK